LFIPLQVRRAKVLGSNTVDYRICQSGWLQDDHHKHIQDISRRVEDMTGLTTKTAEPLQIVNYGIGGQYDSHVDFFPDERAVQEEHGNRIATVLFYVSVGFSKS
jgi:prolyl 4-hydroxylase